MSKWDMIEFRSKNCYSILMYAWLVRKTDFAEWIEMKYGWLGPLVLMVALAACTGDEPSSSPNCEPGELFDEHNEVCVQTNGDDANGQDNVDAGDDDAQDDADEDDNDNGIDPECDKDGDGFLSIECGGEDCDDTDYDINPDAEETCYDVDTNCDGELRGGVECVFYAHTSDRLYSVDPFEMTLQEEGELNDQYGEPTGLLDIDTHPDGNLYGMTRTELFARDDSAGHWIEVATMSDVGDANGLAIDNDGKAYITAEDYFFRIDLADIEDTIETSGFDAPAFNSFYFDPEKITLSGGDYYSSGDCVVSGKNQLYMTSKHDSEEDHLISIDRNSGAATNVGGIGFGQVFGLTFAWGQMYGVTLDGELIGIDTDDGEGELLEEFNDKYWYGSASTPGR